MKILVLIGLGLLTFQPINKNSTKNEQNNSTVSYPCHPAGDIYPCTHPLHPAGDLGPCQHYDIYGNRIHTADVYPCTHPMHLSGDIGPCTHICW